MRGGRRVQAMPITGNAVRDATNATNFGQKTAIYIMEGHRYCFYFNHGMVLAGIAAASRIGAAFVRAASMAGGAGSMGPQHAALVSSGGVYAKAAGIVMA